MTTPLAPGQPAPAFSLPRDGGGEISLADYAGQTVVLFFYPRDATSGCTREAQDFTALLPDFTTLGAAVLGISKDSVKSHDKFRDKYALGLPLLSDEAGDTCERYGVWVKKSMYGKDFMGIERGTFLIRDGVIEQIWRKVKVPGHADSVLAALRAL